MKTQILRAGLTVALAMFASAAHGAKFDPPDLNFEMELYRRYVHAKDRPTVGSPSPYLAKDAYVENYSIQSGETLWSLSQILYGDGSYWPRVWAENHSITNPHLIRPGHRLQFLMGSEDDTPAFRFTEEGDDGGVELARADSSAPMIQIPPPEINPRPVTRLPQSFPVWQNIYKLTPKPIVDYSVVNAKRQKAPDHVFLRAFVVESPIEPVGYFLENDTESGLPVVNQYVYVKMKKGTAREGQHFMIVQNAGRLLQTNDHFDIDDTDAYLIQAAGEIEITEPTFHHFKSSREQEEYDCFRALMTKTTGLALTQFALIPGEIPLVDLSANGPHGSAIANVIGSERHVASTLFGQGDIVFLDKGSKGGVQEGQILDLFVDRTTRYADTPVPFSPAPSGSLKVVKTSGNLATAVILSAHDSILQGDQARPVSERKGDTERKEHVIIHTVKGGEVRAEAADFENIDESALEEELKKDE